MQAPTFQSLACPPPGCGGCPRGSTALILQAAGTSLVPRWAPGTGRLTSQPESAPHPLPLLTEAPAPEQGGRAGGHRGGVLDGAWRLQGTEEARSLSWKLQASHGPRSTGNLLQEIPRRRPVGRCMPHAPGMPRGGVRRCWDGVPLLPLGKLSQPHGAEGAGPPTSRSLIRNVCAGGGAVTGWVHLSRALLTLPLTLPPAGMPP